MMWNNLRNKLMFKTKITWLIIDLQNKMISIDLVLQLKKTTDNK